MGGLFVTIHIASSTPARSISQHNTIYDFGGVYETVCTPERYTLVSVYIPIVNVVHLL